MMHFWKKNSFVVYLFLIWRLGLFAVAYLATVIIPKFGNWFPYADRVLSVTKLPSWIWGFGNFDGVHYLKIAQNGYQAMYSQAFFPLYPLMIKVLNFIPKNPHLDNIIFVDPGYFYTGLILSNLAFLLALGVIYRLFRLDFSDRVAKWSLIAVVAFPTSYYFGSIYTESIFILLVSLSILMVRRQKYLLSGLLATGASVTRITGVLLIPLLLIETLRLGGNKSRIIRPRVVIGIFLPLLGLGLYMFYLYTSVGNPLYFLSAQPMFGAERSSQPFILLPQVFYRYFKIFMAVPLKSLSFLTAFNEIFFTLGVLSLLVVYVKKVRVSYWLLVLLSVLVPTLTGTLSSMPRYVLISFLLFPWVIGNLSNRWRLVWIISSTLVGMVMVGLFTRGYWVA